MSRFAAVLALALLLTLPSGYVAAAGLEWGSLLLAQAARDEREAAQLAARQYGGKVLRVQRDGDRFVVRLLMPDGRIRHVEIPASAPAGRG